MRADVRARTRAARADAVWWRWALGVATVTIALVLGLPVAAKASDGSLPASSDDGAAQRPSEGQSPPEPAASRDDGAGQRPPAGRSVSEPGVIAGDEQAPDAVELDDEDAGGHATRGELAAAARAPRLTRGSRGDAEASDPPAPPEHSDDGAHEAAWQARSASGTAAASERGSQAVNDTDDAHDHVASTHEHADDEDAAAHEHADDQDAAAHEHADREDAAAHEHADHEDVAASAEATPATPRFAGSAAVRPALSQRAAALARRADRAARRTTTPGRMSRFASAQRAPLSGASTATPATQITTPVTTAHGSLRTRPSKPDKPGHARASTDQRTLPMPPPSRRGAETTTTGTVASGGGAFAESPVTGGLVALMLATSAIWFVLRERAHRMSSLLWAAPLERPG